MSTTTQRNSRWSREPLLNEHGKPVVARLTERDISIFQILLRYPLLGANFIHALIGGDYQTIRIRLGLLSRKPNLYLHKPERQRQNASANYTFLIYGNDAKAEVELARRGFVVPARRAPHNLAHELMTNEIMADFEIGATHTEGFRLITWEEIKASEKMPAATLKKPRPHSIDVSFSYQGKQYDFEATADYTPFGIERVLEGKRGYFFFSGPETDMGTEPVDTSDFERSSIAKKLVAYLTIIDQELYKREFGFPHFYIPFVTTTTRRMESMMKHLDRITNGKGSKYILFSTCPSMYSFEERLKPTGTMLTREWQRVGHAPFSFLKS